MGFFEDVEEKVTTDVSLADVYENPRFDGKAKIRYEYDHGDGWEHEFCLIGRAMPGLNQQIQIPKGVNAVCLSGSGHPIAEDSGGPNGWEGLKELFAKARKRDEDGRKDWYKKLCANGDPKGLNPYEWDILEVNDQLIKMFSPDVA